MTKEILIKSAIRTLINEQVKQGSWGYALEEDSAYEVSWKDVLNWLEQQPNRCDSCIHSEERDGSNCYECVKGMADNFEAQPCEDCIERAEVLMHSHIEYDDDGVGHLVIDVEDIKELPSVTPQPKVGKWWERTRYPQESRCWDCSECQETVFERTDYCPNCGAKMEVDK